MSRITLPTGDLNQTRLTEMLAGETNLSQEEADRAVRAFMDIVGRHVAAGFRVRLTNFGSFFARDFQVPRGGLPGRRAEGAKIPSRVRRVRFLASGLLYERVRSAEPVTTLRKRGRGEASR